LTGPAERSLSSAEAMRLEFRVPKALLSSLGYLSLQSVLARPVGSSHLATLSQTSPSTSTITARLEKGVISVHTRCG